MLRSEPWRSRLGAITLVLLARVPSRERRRSVAALDREGWSAVNPSVTGDSSVTATPITGLSKASGHIRAEIIDQVDAARNAPSRTERILLAGEPPAVVSAYCTWLTVDESQITTAGLDVGVDVTWDFDQPAPSSLGHFDLVVSQAIIEHLVDPFGHVTALYQLLGPGGTLIVQTVIPGFPYHCYPVDCVRFFPDWFERVAVRVGAEVVGRYCDDLRISYSFRRP